MTTRSYDVIVVGAGSAGCAAAARLSADPSCSVLVVEAGASSPSAEALAESSLLRGDLRQMTWDAAALEALESHGWSYDGYVTRGGDRKLSVMRGKLLGGSSSVNGAAMIRSTPESYDSWGVPLWSFSAVLDSFVAIERDSDFGGPYHGADGPIPVERPPSEDWWPFHRAASTAMGELGFARKEDINAPTGSGVGPIPRNSVDGVRVSAWQGILEPSLARGNLEVRSDCRVRRIAITGRRATGIVIETSEGTSTVEAGEVVLCAGAIESPHLLFTSGIGAAEELRRRSIPVVADIAAVGQGLQDHPLVVFQATAPKAADAGRNGMTHQQMLCYTAAGSPHRNDMQIEASYGAPPWRDPGPAESGQTDLVLLEIGLELPEGRGELRFDEADPDSPPDLVFGYLEEEADRRRLVEAVRICSEIVATPSCRELGVVSVSPDLDAEPSDRQIEDWLEANIATAFHGYGTCAMAPAGGSDGVVDERCRVHGVENLRVADLSVVPRPISNANATALMIGHHAGGLIRDEG